LATIALVLAFAAPAQAAELSLELVDPAGVRLGDETAVKGVVTDADAPLAGRTVQLEARRHPFTGAWRVRATTRTATDGSFAFAPELDRNHQLRARLVGVDPEPDVLSGALDAFVLPAFRLSYTQRGKRLLRLRQVYTVPSGARLSEPTRFYVGPCRPGADDRCTARRARFRAAPETRRVRAGRYVATARVRIPKSYAGRFQYVSCFVYSPGSGMGDPDQRCPRRYARLR
jgi:hypothetical protein